MIADSSTGTPKSRAPATAGLPSELFTPVFAMGRVAGWTAHCLEQAAEGRLLRPRAAYVGETGKSWLEVAERS